MGLIAGFAPLGASITDINPGLTFWTIVTFVIVFIVLRWKAWGPILQAVKAREELIENAINQAKLEREQADKLLAEQKESIAHARQEAAELIRQNRADVEKMREELMARSRREAEEQLATATRQIAEEKGKAIAEIRSHAVDLAIAGAKKLVEVSLDEPKQKALVNEYLEQLDRGGPRA